MLRIPRMTSSTDGSIVKGTLCTTLTTWAGPANVRTASGLRTLACGVGWWLRAGSRPRERLA